MQTRHIAHIVIEAQTPLKVGSNASDFLQDSPVQKDWNGLPMILGTSIAGVLRKDFKGDKNKLFGDEDSNNKDAKGSEIIISNALLLYENQKVCEELLLEKSKLLQIFENLPIREHTAITEKGVARDNSKFDEEVVYKGTRFKFSIEMIEDDKKSFEAILNLLYKNSFRIGGGSTKGFGKIKVIEIKRASFTKNTYKNYSSSLNYVGLALPNNDDFLLGDTQPTDYTTYKLTIKPDDFFMFGSGFGDSDADATPVYERVIDYHNAKLKDKEILIPASSIKGALAHRSAFYYNKEMLKQKKDHTQVGENNEAVKAIFGHKKELVNDKELGQKGKILISDCFKKIKDEDAEAAEKTFDHVSIDRFTGGAIDGALFQEKTLADDREYEIEILLEKNITQEYIEAFELALKDICSGMLPLGGMTTKGHGVFSGELYRDGEKL